MTKDHSDHWIMIGWYGEQWGFQTNEMTMEHSDYYIVTGWHGMENNRIFKITKRQ
jgi:hypothetical protein